jgi:hypothetical protein
MWMVLRAANYCDGATATLWSRFRHHLDYFHCCVQLHGMRITDWLQAAELEAKLSKLTTAEPAEETGSDDDDDDFGLSITAGAGKKKTGAKKGGKGKKKPAKKGERCISDRVCKRLRRQSNSHGQRSARGLNSVALCSN